MYCSKCGSHINDGLKYCKSCGAKLVEDKDEDKQTPSSILDNLLTTLCVVVVFGLGILVGLVAVLLGYGVDHKSVILIAAFYLVVVAAICYLLLSQVPKLIDANLNKDAAKSEPAQPAQLSAPTTAQLEEHREPVMSITENTTRTLHKAVKNE